jgi:DNA-directed RNA polymerase sigma subunit (sigma70/sigma32)
MKEIARVVGISLSRVSQIREETMVKLKTLLDHIKRRQQSVVGQRGEYLEYA